MIEQTLNTGAVPSVAPNIPAVSSVPTRRAGWKRAAMALVKLLWGMMLTQGVLAVMIVGWSYRLAQRVAWKTWWAQQSGKGGDFSVFAQTHPRFQPHVHWPNWWLAQDFSRTWRDPDARIVFRHGRALLGSGWLNLKLGVQGLFNTWALTMLCGVLWLFAWHAGWNNSFYKGYELAWVGPSSGLLGIALFCLVMLYVPVAQARQAVSGNWRAFYDARVVWVVLRQSWPAFLLLACCYSMISIPVTILKVMPMFFPQIRPGLEDIAPAEALKILRTYFFWAALFVFPAFVFLRMAAARIYAKALLRGLRNGALAWNDLDLNEREALESVGVEESTGSRGRPKWMRAIGWLSSRTAFGCGLVLMFMVWFTFAAQIYIGEFINYHPVIGWLNQPLVQVPFFQYIPAALRPL